MENKEKGKIIAKDLFDKEISTMDIHLISKVTKTTITIDEYIKTSLMQGIDAEELKNSLFRDLEEGGRIFGEFKNAIKATVRGSINRVADIGQYLENDVFLNLNRWITVEDNHVCGLDIFSPVKYFCKPRHGLVKSFNVWETEFGLPKSGQTVCGERCRCFLVPEEVTQLLPIQRERNNGEL